MPGDERADLSALVKMYSDHPDLAVNLYTDADGKPRGYVTLRGSFTVIGFWIGDGGDDPYPLKDLSIDLEAGVLQGTLAIKGFPNLNIEATFGERYSSIAVTVKAKEISPIPDIWLGDLTMIKVDTEPTVTLPIDTGITDTGQATP